MKKRFGLLVGLVTVMAIPLFAVPDSVFHIKPVYGKQVRIVTSILETGHFRKLPFNDSLSSVVLDNYLASLDNSRIYFLKSDIAGFEKYRYQLDDLARSEQVDPAFEMYRVFQLRFNERMDYVLKHLVGKAFDFSVDEYYETNREQAPWPAHVNELNAIWTQIIKNQALGLKLAGKTQAEIKETLEKRYERFIKSMSQTNADDVFSTYLNVIAEAYDPQDRKSVV